MPGAFKHDNCNVSSEISFDRIQCDVHRASRDEGIGSTKEGENGNSQLFE